MSETVEHECPWCKKAVPPDGSPYPVTEYESCPHCRGSFSFSKPLPRPHPFEPCSLTSPCPGRDRCHYGDSRCMRPRSEHRSAPAEPAPTPEKPARLIARAATLLDQYADEMAHLEARDVASALRAPTPSKPADEDEAAASWEAAWRYLGYDNAPGDNDGICEVRKLAHFHATAREQGRQEYREELVQISMLLPNFGGVGGSVMEQVKAALATQRQAGAEEMREAIDEAVLLLPVPAGALGYREAVVYVIRALPLPEPGK